MKKLKQFHYYMKQHNTFGSGPNYGNNYFIALMIGSGFILPIVWLIDVLKN
jgi:hypothetical protein